MKLQQKKMPAKKPRQRRKQPKMSNMNTTTSSGSDSDVIIISDSSDTTIDLGNYVAAGSTHTFDTITLDPNIYNIGSIGSSGGSGGITYTTSGYNWNTITSNPSVNISSDGITMQPESDLKIGDRSLKEFMDRVEDRLAILHPNQELEERWEQLKDLRRQYEALEKDILEKEKLMKILKET